MTSIGKQIVAARREKGMTQEALAKALNLSRATISNYEGDRRLPDAETLLRLSKVLDYSFEDEAPKRPEAEARAAERAEEPVSAAPPLSEEARAPAEASEAEAVPAPR